MKKILIAIIFVLISNCTARVILKMTDTETDIYNKKPEYSKRNVNQFIGFREYSLPVTPNKPQKFKSTWFTTKAELEKHQTQVCQSGVQTIVIRGDYWDYLQHFFMGGLTSSKSIEVFCN